MDQKFRDDVIKGLATLQANQLNMEKKVDALPQTLVLDEHPTVKSLSSRIKLNRIFVIALLSVVLGSAGLKLFF